jgi:hypothetical protein
MPSRITKDFKKVFAAFCEGKEAKGDKVSFPGYGDGSRCHTDGHNFYSYKMLVAKRFTDNAGKLMYVVISRDYGPSNTTRRHIDALVESLPQASIVSEHSTLTWDFKFNVSVPNH